MIELPEPLRRTTKIFMLHMNFRSRAEEHGDWPEIPLYHLKPPSTLSVSGADIPRPNGVNLLIAEGEVAIIIGTRAHRVPLDQAWQYVSHVAPANDVTILDFNWAESPAMVRAKGWDGFTPIGPLVDARMVDPNNLTLRLLVNGELRQECHTSELIFSFERLVSELSFVMTLEPGDIILTGTPAGARPMLPGDEVVVELGNLSTLRNRVVDDPDPLPDYLPAPRISPRVRAVASGVVAYRRTTLDEKGLRALSSAGVEQVIGLLADKGIHVSRLKGVLPARGSRAMAGYAFTLRQVPARPDMSSVGLDDMAKKAVAAVRATGPNEIVVAEGALSQRYAGDLLKRFEQREVAGVVMSGHLDTSLKSALPIFTRQQHDGTPDTELIPVAWNIPIECSGQLIVPGDIIVGDESGIIAVPAAAAVELAMALMASA